MNYQFDQLEKLVTGILCPQYFVQQANKAAFVDKTVVLMHDESMRANGLLWHEFINCENEQQARHYVQHHQRSIIRLLNYVSEYENEIGKEQVGKKQVQAYMRLIQNAEQDLEFILSSMLSDSSNYFQQQKAIPQTWKSKYMITVKLLQIKLAEFVNAGKIDIELPKILSEPLTKFMLDTAVVSFNDFDYLKNYVSNLTLLLENTEVTNDELCNFLLQNNFNLPLFFNYYINKISDQQAEGSGLSYLYLQLKKINQVQKKTVSAYNKDHSSIIEQVGTWLSEEIYFQEKKQLYNSHTSTISAERIPFENKIDTKLSVAHLSLAVKLLFDTGVIQNKNLSDVIKMVAGSFRTEKSECISEGSLRNKVYNIESASVETMKDIIINLLNAVKKY